MNDCSDCSEDEKKRLLRTYFDEKGKNGVSKLTKGQVQKAHDSQSIGKKKKSGK